MESHAFDPKFKKVSKPSGPVQVFRTRFHSMKAQDWQCDGCLVGGDSHPTDEEIWKMPEFCYEKSIVDSLIREWYLSCRNVFSSPPSLDSLLAKPVVHSCNRNFAIPALAPDEEDQEWVLLWTVVEFHFCKNSIELVWAPTDKRRLVPRIEENFENEGVEVQNPEESQYRIIESSTDIPTDDAQWIQEIHDLPLSDRPALRLEADLNAARERFRRRVRDARLRAKLARYRAERLAQQQMDKFGVYPDADAEEAQTEQEDSSESESG